MSMTQQDDTSESRIRRGSGLDRPLLRCLAGVGAVAICLSLPYIVMFGVIIIPVSYLFGVPVGYLVLTGVERLLHRVLWITGAAIIGAVLVSGLVFQIDSIEVALQMIAFGLPAAGVALFAAERVHGRTLLRLAIAGPLAYALSFTLQATADGVW